MENSRELISISRQVVFDATNYGYEYGEITMMAIIPEINEDAWTSADSSQEIKVESESNAELLNQKLSVLNY